MPAEILRDRETDDTPKAEAPDFGALATAAAPSLDQRITATERDLTSARQEQKTAGEGVVAAQQRRKEGMAPVIAQTQQAIGSPMPPPPPPTVLPPQPSRKLTDFLAPVDGEQPENTISKLIQATTLMATGLTGLARGDATAALASMKGALQGWQEGDKQRADRAFADWKAQTDKLLAEADDRHRTYREIFEDKKLSIDQQMKMLELAGISHGHDIAVEASRLTNADKAVLELDKDYQKLLTLVDHRNRLTLMQQEREKDREWKGMMIRLSAGLKADEKAKAKGDSPFGDEELTTMAKLFIAEKVMPSFGMGASAREDRAKFWRKVSDLSAAAGGVEGIAARHAAGAGLKAELANVMKVRGLVEAFSQTAAKNLRDAEQLSNEVDRDGSPMINKWLLKGRKAWSGEAKVADFDVAVRTAINETARVLNSANASGVISDAARHEIEDMLNTALNKEQFTAVVKRLHREMENRRSSYEHQIRIINDEVRRNAAIQPKPSELPAGWSIKERQPAAVTP